MLQLMDSDYPPDVQIAAADELIILHTLTAIDDMVVDIAAQLASDVEIDQRSAEWLILGRMSRLLARLKPGQAWNSANPKASAPPARFPLTASPSR